MRKVHVTVEHEGYPSGKRTLFRAGEHEVPNDYAELIVEKKNPPHARYVDEAPKAEGKSERKKAEEGRDQPRSSGG